MPICSPNFDLNVPRFLPKCSPTWCPFVPGQVSICSLVGNECSSNAKPEQNCHIKSLQKIHIWSLFYVKGLFYLHRRRIHFRCILNPLYLEIVKTILRAYTSLYAYENRSLGGEFSSWIGSDFRCVDRIFFPCYHDRTYRK